MKAHIDRSGCIGCGACTDTCPEVFRMADDDLAEVYGEVSEKNVDAAKEAAENCPVNVITIED